MGGFISDFTDDVLGFDPNGGGIYGVARDVLGDTIADDWLGMDPNGGGAVGFYNIAGPAALAYLGGGAAWDALAGTEAGSSLASTFGNLSSSIGDLIGTAGGTMTPEMVQAATEAYLNSGYTLDQAASMIAKATGNSASSVLSAINGDIAGLTTSGTGLQGLLGNLGNLGSSGINAAKGLVTMLGGTPQQVSGLGQLLGLGAGIYGTMSQKELAQKQEDLAKWMVENADPYREYRKEQEIPFMQQLLERAPDQLTKAEDYATKAGESLSDMFYQDRLKQTYTDPLAVYNSPEMQALTGKFMSDIARRDAAAGRTSQYGARALEGQQNFLTNILPTYRQGLTQGQTSLTQQGTGLGNLFAQQGTYGQNLAKMGMPGATTAGAGVPQAGEMLSQANAMNEFMYSPLFQSLGYSVPSGTAQ